MVADDIQALHTSFGLGQGWEGMSVEKFTNYYEEQASGIRQVLIATIADKAVGYLTLIPNDEVGPFANKQLPTVKDFNVLIKFRGLGVGSRLMDEVERIAKELADEICLSVGLYTDYGTAQRMYVKRGYVPDGSGVWHHNRNLHPYEACVNDDDLVLYMSKRLF